MAPANYGNKPSYTIHVYAGWEASVPRDSGKAPQAMVGRLLHPDPKQTELVLAQGVEHLPRRLSSSHAHAQYAMIRQRRGDGWMDVETRRGWDEGGGPAPSRSGIRRGRRPPPDRVSFLHPTSIHHFNTHIKHLQTFSKTFLHQQPSTCLPGEHLLTDGSSSLLVSCPECLGFCRPPWIDGLEMATMSPDHLANSL